MGAEEDEECYKKGGDFKDMARKSQRRWIQQAIKKPGALRAQAAKEGALRDGIDEEWLRRAAKRPGITGRRARLALTLKKLAKRRKKK